MKINSKVLSIPPFLSTSWKNVYSIQMEGLEHDDPFLVIFLTNGIRVELPPLDTVTIEAIFVTHAKYIEELPSKVSSLSQNNARNNEPLLSLGIPPIKLGSLGIEHFGAAMQHNPNETNSPDIPQEIKDKISAISKVMGIEDPEMLPKAEPHCNCTHCQIARAIRNEKEEFKEKLSEEIEEEVTSEDLRFHLWDISQTNEKLYVVSNPLDAQENYNVFLGDPVGCTCGQKNCEHIRAVLNS